MSVSKQEVLRSATKLFKERGFLITSVQDVADDCQIAKGSVYKYFASKEDLFSEVFDQCFQIFFAELEQLYQVAGFSPRERFLRQLIFRFQYFLEYKFILAEFVELPIQQDTKFFSVRLRGRGRLMQWHKDCLLDLYGQEIEPHLWDLVFIYKAILTVYLFWIIEGEQPLSLPTTANFILEKLDALVEYDLRKGGPPLLEQSSFEQFIYWGLEGRKGQQQQVLTELLDQIDIALTTLPVGKAQRKELQEILALLKAELGKTEPQKSLIRALIAYLESENNLKSLILQLKNVISR
jgi:AcrR family transcriptional regulator